MQIVQESGRLFTDASGDKLPFFVKHPEFQARRIKEIRQKIKEVLEQCKTQIKTKISFLFVFLLTSIA